MEGMAMSKKKTMQRKGKRVDFAISFSRGHMIKCIQIIGV